jgi:hypothetical protein
MEFEFDKFVVDIEKRDEQLREKREVPPHEIDIDQRRRKRSELYHERWQNQTKWEK